MNSIDTIKIRASKIDKSFPGVKALDGIDFAVRKGTVHALCGENGAGKSTLMKIFNGIYKPDAGQIFIDEQPVSIHSPIEAGRHGIAMIAQELNYVPEMTVAENLFLGHLPTNKFGKINWKFVNREAETILKAEKLPYKAQQKLNTLTVSDIQMLEIIKAVYRSAQIIIMDEPTSAIAQKEVDNLFEKIADLKKNDVTILYISHKMDEVFKIADDITILRDGSVIETRKAVDFTLESVISLMVGRKLDNSYPKEEVAIGPTVFEVKNLYTRSTFKDISFHIKEGEIIGLAGLVGAGRTEVVRAIFGLDPLDKGEVFVHGKAISIKHPESSIKQKIAMLSEDRRLYGIIPILSVKKNATISCLRKIIYHGRAHSKIENKLVDEYFNAMSVKTPSKDTLIKSLSGGNQQKVLLAKWMLTDPDVLLLDEPTRGIDVGAKYEIYRLMTDLVKKGKAVLMISSELPELMGMCDRIYVMSQGMITGELKRSEFSQERILKLAMAKLD